VTLGVVLSTYLNAPISLRVTLLIVILGQPVILNYIYTESLPDDPDRPGGRVFEASLRLINKENMVNVLPDNLATKTVKSLDSSVRYVFKLVHAALPDLKLYDRKIYVAEGFDIPWEELVATLVRLLMYLFPIVLIGYFLLSTREVAN
jgi:hypothetical protein